MAGIIAADRNGAGMHGVAFENAEIIAARWDLMSPISAPVKDVIDMGAKVVNFSLGVDLTADINASTIDRYTDQLDDYLDSVRYQIENNVVFVFPPAMKVRRSRALQTGFRCSTSLRKVWTVCS